MVCVSSFMCVQIEGMQVFTEVKLTDSKKRGKMLQVLKSQAKYLKPAIL